MLAQVVSGAYLPLTFGCMSLWAKQAPVTLEKALVFKVGDSVSVQGRGSQQNREVV